MAVASKGHDNVVRRDYGLDLDGKDTNGCSTRADSTIYFVKSVLAQIRVFSGIDGFDRLHQKSSAAKRVGLRYDAM
jgi:hypothetical protein